MTLSVVMVTYNSADVVEGALQSVDGLWDELLVGDVGSTDGTVGIVKKYRGEIIRPIRPILPIRPMNETIEHNDKNGKIKDKTLGERKQELVERAKGDWILVLDADERVGEELRREIESLAHSPRRSHGLTSFSLPPSEVVNAAAYRIPYQNYVFGRPVDYGGERYSKVRLFRKGFGRVSPEALHEEVIIRKEFHKATPCKSQGSGLEDKGWIPGQARNGKLIGELKGVIHHHSYRTPGQLITKFTRYAWTAAGMLAKKQREQRLDPRVRGDDKEWGGDDKLEAGSRVPPVRRAGKPGMTADGILKQLFLYGPHMVWARFIKEKGYKDGWRGLVLALAFGYMEGLTYWFLLFRK